MNHHRLSFQMKQKLLSYVLYRVADSLGKIVVQFLREKLPLFNAISVDS